LVSETWFAAFLVELAFSPDEWPRGLVVVGDERLDVGDEFWDAVAVASGMPRIQP
jgi:hypothetical protein